MINVKPGQDARVLVVWKNNANEYQAPQMRWDLRKEGSFGDPEAWLEGPVLNVPSVAPGMEGEADLYCTVPNNWDETKVDAKLMVIGYHGAQWYEEDVFYVTEEGNGEPPEEEGGFPWVWALLVGGGAAVLAVAASKKKPKKVGEKTKS